MSYYKPSIHELGTDLLSLSLIKRVLTIVTPFVFFGLYFLSALHNYWIPAVLCTMGLSFTSYGSTSHDLVHGNLKINKWANEALLTVVELICFRSGHAYRASHLHHHKRYPHEDDIEGAASRMSLMRALAEGIIFQYKLYFWALQKHKGTKEFNPILLEGVAVILFAGFCFYSLSFTVIYFVYFVLMIMGSWIIPLITSYLVHTPEGENEWHQTKLFRGKFFSIIAFKHLYHLEHHLYPMVPHKNWPELARRLDPYLQRNQILPVIVNLKSIVSD